MGSYGQTLIKEYLTLMLDKEPLEDYRPEWLHGLELDLFWPDLGFAVEFQGDQHFIPAYGQSALFRQRRNDKSKGRTCETLGIYLMKVDAMQLEYTRLNRMMKKAFPEPHFRRLIKRKEIRSRLRLLNKKAIAYRKSLKASFGSPTAHKKGESRKRARAAWYSANAVQGPMAPASHA